MSGERRQQILEVLARELEARPGARLTTATLAARLGVSEAALYRHFPSKAKMFDALIDFAEDSVFGLITRILDHEPDGLQRCAKICELVLVFAARNPGITRILTGDILTGEHERLRGRVNQFFERLETQLRSVLRDALLSDGCMPDRAEVNAAASLLVAAVAGRLAQFVRSAWRVPPQQAWDQQWPMLARAIFSQPAA